MATQITPGPEKLSVSVLELPPGHDLESTHIEVLSLHAIT